jgi:hypothetical protein
MSSGRVCVVMFDFSVVVWIILCLSLGALACAGFALYFSLRDRYDARLAELALLKNDMDFVYERVAEIDNVVHSRAVLGSADVAMLQRWVDDSMSKISRLESFLDSLD